MAGTGHPALRYGAIAIAALLAVVALVALIVPWNAWRAPLAAYLSHRFQRTVSIDGDLDVGLGWTTRVRADRVTISNAEWSDLQPMGRARSVTLTFRLGSLLRASPDNVRFSDANAVLERNAAGEPNWDFGGRGLGGIGIDRGVVRYRDPGVGGDVTLTLESASIPDHGDELRFDGKGTLRGEAFAVVGHGGSLNEFRRNDQPYPLAFDLRSGETEIKFDGTIVPASPWDANGALHVRGPDLSKLHPLVTARLPWTPRYDLSGEVTHAQRRWNFRRVSGTVGTSDVAGDLDIDPTKPRPLTTVDFSSRKLIYHDLGGFVGLPRTTPATRASADQRGKSDGAAPNPGRVLPQRPFKLAELRSHDVDVRFHGADFRWGRFALEGVVTHITLRDGVMRFAPFDFAIADGSVATSVTLDVTKREPVAHGKIDAHRVELKRIFPKLASPHGSAGRFTGHAQFETTGDSVADMFAAADGDAAVAMGGGEASTLQLVLTNLDLARAAALLIGGDRTAEIRCAVATLHSRRGVLTPDMMVIDTSAELIRGAGTINFRDETYDLRLDASSKKPSLLALRGPVVVGGTFRTPVVHPAAAPVAARVGAAVGLGAIAPPLALLALIDPGNTPDVDCSGLYADARIASVPGPTGRRSARAGNGRRVNGVAESSP